MAHPGAESNAQVGVLGDDVIAAIARGVERGYPDEAAAAAADISPAVFGRLRRRGETVEDQVSAWYRKHPAEQALLLDDEVLDRIGIPAADQQCWRLVQALDAARAIAAGAWVQLIADAAAGVPTTRTTTTSRARVTRNRELVTTTDTQTVTTSRRDWRAAAWLLERSDPESRSLDRTKRDREPYESRFGPVMDIDAEIERLLSRDASET